MESLVLWSVDDRDIVTVNERVDTRLGANEKRNSNSDHLYIGRKFSNLIFLPSVHSTHRSVSLLAQRFTLLMAFIFQVDGARRSSGRSLDRPSSSSSFSLHFLRLSPLYGVDSL
jgi:hypothetical protein